MSTSSCLCICGIRIVVIDGEETQGVAAHNATRAHQRWREWGGMEREVREGCDLTTAELMRELLGSQRLPKPLPLPQRNTHGQRVWPDGGEVHGPLLTDTVDIPLGERNGTSDDEGASHITIGGPA